MMVLNPRLLRGISSNWSSLKFQISSSFPSEFGPPPIFRKKLDQRSTGSVFGFLVRFSSSPLSAPHDLTPGRCIASSPADFPALILYENNMSMYFLRPDSWISVRGILPVLRPQNSSNARCGGAPTKSSTGRLVPTASAARHRSHSAGLLSKTPLTGRHGHQPQVGDSKKGVKKKKPGATLPPAQPPGFFLILGGVRAGPTKGGSGVSGGDVPGYPKE